MKYTLLISRLITGLVFVFSGFVKAIDPSGFAIKLDEYLFAYHLVFLSFMAMPVAITLSAAELAIGLNLLAGVKMKLTSWLLFLFLTFFTILTFISALTNPVSDCGCFGDAIKLTNWQTFLKNIVLLIPALNLFIYRRKLNQSFSSGFEWILSLVNFSSGIALSLFCLFHEPVIDFRPYKIGANIPENMTIPDGAPLDKYETILVYEKEGKTQEFTESNFPWQDSTWRWVETRQKLIRKGYEPPIHDFIISTREGYDITEQLLADSDYTFLIIAPQLEKASKKGMQQMNELAIRAGDLGFSVYCLTSSANSAIDLLYNDLQPAYTICTIDETTVKTMMRSNPGIMIIREGTILGKWNYRDAPAPGDLKNTLSSVIMNKSRAKAESLSVILLALIVVVFYSLVLHFKGRSQNSVKN
jgi:uncharacterized membrane protein YphA (DoxX/SURF4 family)